jgi:hypothetical protein
VNSPNCCRRLLAGTSCRRAPPPSPTTGRSSCWLTWNFMMDCSYHGNRKIANSRWVLQCGHVEIVNQLRSCLLVLSSCCWCAQEWYAVFFSITQIQLCHGLKKRERLMYHTSSSLKERSPIYTPKFVSKFSLQPLTLNWFNFQPPNSKNRSKLPLSPIWQVLTSFL